MRIARIEVLNLGLETSLLRTSQDISLSHWTLAPVSGNASRFKHNRGKRPMAQEGNPDLVMHMIASSQPNEPPLVLKQTSDQIQNRKLYQQSSYNHHRGRIASQVGLDQGVGKAMQYINRESILSQRT